MSDITLLPAAELGAVRDSDPARSDWMRIIQTRIDAFAPATEDHQWVNVDGSVAHSAGIAVEVSGQSRPNLAGEAVYVTHGS